MENVPPSIAVVYTQSAMGENYREEILCSICVRTDVYSVQCVPLESQSCCQPNAIENVCHHRINTNILATDMHLMKYKPESETKTNHTEAKSNIPFGM